MAIVTPRSKANRKYNEKAYDRISIVVPKGRRQDIEEYAKEQGSTINGITNRFYMGALGIEDDDMWKHPDSNTTTE